MNRIDRLTAILIYLQTKRIVKAKEIAQRYNISLRTVYRDIRALEDAGIPIGSKPGEGYFIVDGYHLPPVMFTKNEAGALLIGGKLIEKFSDTSVKNNFTSALDKIISVLHLKEKDYLDTLNSHIEVLKDPHAPKNGFPDNLLADIQSVLGQKKAIKLHYHSGYKNETTQRLIEPIGLCFYGANWHLIAYCKLREDYRDFRVDRVKAVDITDIGFDPSKHASLEYLVKKIVRSTNLKSAVVRFDISVVNFIKDQKYYYGFVDEKKINNQIEMNFLVSSYQYFANWLFSFTDKVKVIEPSELTDLVQSLTNTLYKHHHS